MGVMNELSMDSQITMESAPKRQILVVEKGN